MTILPAIALMLGGLVAFFNWYSIYASRKSGRFVSTVPLIGSALLVLGFLGFRHTRPYAWLGIIIDYGTLSLMCAAPMLIREAWQISSINLLHRFAGANSGRRDDIRLFRKSIFTLRCVYEPPVPCDEYGALVQSYGFRGKWHEREGVFRLEEYADGRVLEIRKAGARFVTTEQNYPPDKKYPYDKLDGLELRIIT